MPKSKKAEKKGLTNGKESGIIDELSERGAADYGLEGCLGARFGTISEYFEIF